MRADQHLWPTVRVRHLALVKAVPGEVSMLELGQLLLEIYHDDANLAALYADVDRLEELRLVTTRRVPGGAERGYREKRVVRIASGGSE